MANAVNQRFESLQNVIDDCEMFAYEVVPSRVVFREKVEARVGAVRQSNPWFRPVQNRPQTEKEEILAKIARIVGVALLSIGAFLVGNRAQSRIREQQTLDWVCGKITEYGDRNQYPQLQELLKVRKEIHERHLKKYTTNYTNHLIGAIGVLAGGAWLLVGGFVAPMCITAGYIITFLSTSGLFMNLGGDQADADADTIACYKMIGRGKVSQGLISLARAELGRSSSNLYVPF